MDPFSIKGKHIVITGASSGFGHHFAGVLAEAGAKVVLGARRMDRIQTRVDELNAAGHESAGVVLDVTDSDSIENFFDQAEALFGRIDVVINNAGVEPGAKTYAMLEEDDWDMVMDTNLKAPWKISKRYSEKVTEKSWGGGNIINIASITPFRTIKGQLLYADPRRITQDPDTSV